MFSISDLHLSLDGDKPMDRFGSHWVRHWEKVEASWRELVSEQDLVLMPGDHSWAMRLEESDRDLGFITSLPGIKVLSRGNHDYWWQSLGKMRKRFPELHFLQNDALTVGEAAICGTRGWNLPGRDGFSDPHDDKIFQREVQRLRLSAQAMGPATRRFALVHYPPLAKGNLDTEFTAVLEEARVDFCVYGHLHLGHNHDPFQGVHRGVDYRLVACDFLEFKPLLLTEL